MNIMLCNVCTFLIHIMLCNVCTSLVHKMCMPNIIETECNDNYSVIKN